MPSENDPFEMLRKKLEAKKKGHQPAASARPEPKPAPRPVATAPAPSAAQKPAAPSGQPTAPQAQARPAAPAPAASPKAAPAVQDPGAPPKRFQKSLFASEDLKKMARSTEQVSGDVPENFETHRFDTAVDPEEKKVVRKKAVTRVQKPKGFKSDRFDRG